MERLLCLPYTATGTGDIRYGRVLVPARQLSLLVHRNLFAFRVSRFAGGSRVAFRGDLGAAHRSFGDLLDAHQLFAQDVDAV